MKKMSLFFLVPITLTILYVVSYIGVSCGINLIGGSAIWLSGAFTMIAGEFTLLGVIWTLKEQKKSEDENKRKEAQPVFNIGIKCTEGCEQKGSSIRFEANKITNNITMFQRKGNIELKIKLLSVVAYDVKCYKFYTNDNIARCNQYNSIDKSVMTQDELISIMISDDSMAANVLKKEYGFTLAYEDIYENHYEQEIIFDMDNTILTEMRNENLKVKRPILVKPTIKC